MGPGRHRGGTGTNAVGTTDGGQYSRNPPEQGSPAPVQVVRVLVVREQHHIDPVDVLGATRWPGSLDQAVTAAGVILAGRVEGRVGEEPEPTQLQDRRGPTKPPSAQPARV